MDHQDDIESLWQRVYHSTDPETVLADFFHHTSPSERERLLRRCYQTGEQFGVQLERQELIRCTALAYIYTFGLQVCSAQQLQITPSPAVAALIKDRRYQLYSSIQRRPGWRHFPYNITPSDIWRFKNKKEYLGQDILRLYVKIAYRTPDFDTALALLTSEYHSSGTKRLTKAALNKIIDELPTTVPGLQTLDSPPSLPVQSPAANDSARQRPLSRTPTINDNTRQHPLSRTPAINDNTRQPPLSPTPVANHSARQSPLLPRPLHLNLDAQHTPSIDIERRRRRPREPSPADEVSDHFFDPPVPENSLHLEEDFPNHRDLSIISDIVQTDTPLTRRSPPLPPRSGDHATPSRMSLQEDQQRKRSRVTHGDVPETSAVAFERMIAQVTTFAKQYHRLAAELANMELSLQRESSSVLDIRTRWEAACNNRTRAERNLTAQKEIFMSLEEDSNNTSSNLMGDMASLVNRLEAQVSESGHDADALKVELDESEERVNGIHNDIKVKVAKMSKIGQDWGWGDRQSELYEAYHWIGKTFGKAGAEDHCKELQAAADLAGSTGDSASSIADGGM
ncbi:hypothetical protein FKW77_000768 [Venturia effusa]|uniref:Uncharacterized protein n=1 Tax=Venturia effusa TaxID=50376 RepID=A0A517LRE3_9PEZI|nr:hypothetical protein FKW77_000768 [Venturia effusa]